MQQRNQKGFTLIELLAVIVILAVIALIATPLVLNVIERAKQGAAKNSAYGYIEALERDFAIRMIEDSTALVPSTVETVDVDVKGNKPTSVSLYLEGGNVKSGTMLIEGYTVTLSDGTVTKVER